MNLVRDAIDALSGFGFRSLADQIGPGMPRHFLVSTLNLQPNLARYRKEVEEIAAVLTPEPGGVHTNPEFFAQVALLSERARAGGNPEPLLEALRVQTGMAAPADADNAGDTANAADAGGTGLEDGPCRLQHVDGFCYRAERKRLVRLPAWVVAEIDGYPGRALLPYSGLFSDLLEPSLYPSNGGAYDRESLLARLASAFALLAEAVPDLAEDLSQLVRTTVLTPYLGAGQRWSYNLRLAYFGGVFVDPFAVGPHGIAESLLHEYSHQRLWQWWSYEPPSGLPPPSATVRSPITGRDKPAQVMVHALVIYVAAHAFHQACLRRGAGAEDDELDWVTAREKHLRSSIPPLYKSLCTEVPAETTVRRLLDQAMTAFAAAEAP